VAIGALQGNQPRQTVHVETAKGVIRAARTGCCQNRAVGQLAQSETVWEQKEVAKMASAFPNLSEIVTTTLRNRTGELADNMSRNNAALLRLTRKGNLKTFSGGRTIVQELNYADNQTYQWYSGLASSPRH
jgi:hypothetical protein